VRRVLLILAAVACLAPATALGATPRTSLIDVEDEVMCVSCNVALNIAESPQAYAQRQEIQRLVDQGLTKDQVKDRLVEQYGKRVLALPESEGFDRTVYLVPIAVVVVLLATLAVLVPRWRRRGPDDTDDGRGAAPAPLDARDSARLDAELAAFDR